MKRLGALPGQITDSAQEAINTDIFIELIPVQTRAAPNVLIRCLVDATLVAG